MWLPETIQIGPYVYTVKRDYVFRERVDLWGQQDGTALEIRLSQANQGSRPHETRDAVTKLHELLHAVSDSFLPTALGLKEEQVDMLAKGLLDTIRRNEIDLLNTDVEWADGNTEPEFEHGR